MKAPARLLTSSVVAGLIMFAWQAASNVLMPWTSLAVDPLTNEQPIVERVLLEAPESGTYFVPYEEDAAERGEPTIFLAVRREGSLPFIQAVSGQVAANVLAMFLAAILLRRLSAPRFTLKVGVAVCLGVIGWLSASLPHFLWWSFSDTFVAIELLNTSLGWALGGTALAAFDIRDRRGAGGSPLTERRNRA